MNSATPNSADSSDCRTAQYQLLRGLSNTSNFLFLIKRELRSEDYLVRRIL